MIDPRLTDALRRVVQLERRVRAEVVAAAVNTSIAALQALLNTVEAGLADETNDRIAGDGELDDRLSLVEAEFGTYPTDFADLQPFGAPPPVGVASDIGTPGNGFAYADHTHAGGSGGSPGAWTALDYASSPGSGVWQEYATYSGYKIMVARARLGATGDVECRGGIQRVGLGGPAAAEYMCRLPAGVRPTFADPIRFRCAAAAGDVSVEVTGTGDAAGAGWLKCYDGVGSPGILIDLSSIRFAP